MRFRKLRISWSVLWGVVATLSVALWIRSYSYLEVFSACKVSETRVIAIVTLPGVLGVAIIPISDSPSPWSRESEDAVEWWTGFADPEHLPYASRAIGIFELGCWYAVAPYWFVTPICMGFMLAPWLRWRFSLRTLLIATAVVAVVLGMVVWFVR